MRKVLQKKVLTSILDKIIKTGSKIAINISEKILKLLTQHPNINNPSNFYVNNLVENFYHFYANPQLKVDKDIG
jgi:ABC-type proline/glycine betaine transport system ATPase subunit